MHSLDTVASSISEFSGHRLSVQHPSAAHALARFAMAITFRNAEDSINHGKTCLLPNSHVNWLALRNAEAGKQCLAIGTTAHAKLRFGMPSIDFTDSIFDTCICDIKRHGFFHPAPERIRDVRIIAAMARRMEEFFQERYGQIGALPTNGRSFPTAYLSFPAQRIDEVCCVPLRIEPQPIARLIRGSSISKCSARPLRIFCERFFSAVGKGLPLRATGPMTYGGPVPGTFYSDLAVQTFDGYVGHRFYSHADGSNRVFYLPRTAQILIHPDQRLAGDELWAYALPVRPSPRPRSFYDLIDSCGGEANLVYLEWLWLRHQIIEDADRPGEALLPAELSCLAARHVPPVGLYWDLSPCEKYVNAQSEAVILPLLALRNDWSLRCSLPGQVDLNANVNPLALRSFARRRRRPAPRPGRTPAWVARDLSPE